MRMSRCLLLLSIFIFLFVAGCGTDVRAVKPSRQLSLGADELAKKVAERNSEVNSLKGMAKVRLTTARTDVTVREVVVAKRPSSLRLETLGFLGTPVMVFATNGETLNVSSEKRFVTTRLHSKRPASLPFPFNLLATDEATSILLGRIPVVWPARAEMSYLEKEDIYLLTLTSENGTTRQDIYIDAESMLVRKTEIVDDGLGSTLVVIFGGYKEIAGVQLPKEIEVSISPNPSMLRITYDEPEINVPVEDAVFALTPLEGVEVLDLSSRNEGIGRED